MNIVRTVRELREVVARARRDDLRVGLVPTMGAFHEGHLALMRRAGEICGLVVVSLFVNPAQFNEAADLDRYPRDEAGDAGMAEGAGVQVLFAPSVAEVYPEGFSTTVDVTGVSEPLEGAVRGPAHFRGVATVVAKLLNMAQPDDAFFGQKDAQQAVLVRRMVRDLDLPVRIEVCPTVREPDGLAMSSRNVLLTPDARRRAPALHAALRGIEARIEAGERDTARLVSDAASMLAAHEIVPEYLAVVSATSLRPVDRIDGEVLVAIAARFGAVRLIDNVMISPVPASTG